MSPLISTASSTSLDFLPASEVRVRGTEGEKERSDALKVLVKHSLKSDFIRMAEQTEVQLGTGGLCQREP